MTDLDLCYLPAHEALRRFKARTLSPVELMEAVIARAEAVKDPVNAFTFTHFDEAMHLAGAGGRLAVESTGSGQVIWEAMRADGAAARLHYDLGSHAA